jgi:hypothetical protein
MKKILTLATAALLLCASLASAAPSGINLYGFASAGSGKCGDVTGRGAVITGNCGTIGTAMKLVSSVVVPRDVHGLAGLQQEVDVVTTAANVPDYWRFDACRAGKITPLMNSTVPSDGVVCIATIWDYGTTTPISVDGYNVAAGQPNMMQLNLAGGVAAPFDVPADGSELAVASLQINNGPTSCLGCATAACILLKSIKISEDGVPVALLVQNASAANYATWIGNGPSAPPGYCPAATPATNRTWGQLKSLYR